VKYIKIYGDRRTGTNFLQQLCRQNFENITVFDNQFGWKHGFPLDKDKMSNWVVENPKRKSNYGKIFKKILEGDHKLYPCIIIKNPYSWYSSIKNYIGNKFNMDRSYTRYNSIYRSYKKLYEGKHDNNIYGKSVIIKYEDLLSDTNRKITEIANFFKITIKKSIVIPRLVPMSGKFTNKKKEFYLSGGTFGLSDKLVQEINDLVDWELMKFYGYKPTK